MIPSDVISVSIFIIGCLGLYLWMDSRKKPQHTFLSVAFDMAYLSDEHRYELEELVRSTGRQDSDLAIERGYLDAFQTQAIRFELRRRNKLPYSADEETKLHLAEVEAMNAQKRIASAINVRTTAKMVDAASKLNREVGKMRPARSEDDEPTKPGGSPQK